METRYNLKSPAVKRLMKEAAELKDPTDHYHAQPLEDNLFEWHFTVRGPPDSDFDGGVYHGRIVLPPEYPMKPPSIILLTANGRFEVGKKICLSISGHHPETWQPSWSIRTALLAIIGFMPTKGEGAIGSLDYTPEERRALAKKSQDFCCEGCGSAMKDVLLPLKSGIDSSQADQEAKELARQISFKAEVNSSGKTIAESDLNQSFSLNDSQDDLPTTFQGAAASTSLRLALDLPSCRHSECCCYKWDPPYPVNKWLLKRMSSFRRAFCNMAPRIHQEHPCHNLPSQLLRIPP
ncbi:ubiquitin-conjugating enzyme E2 J1 isoform X2 [Rattus norvegicus]|uniref:Ubiquitin-conjugating enzyme E2, J1 n=1 Tax=Rattus norvegicus TaxID=10116 RepID=A0ABK0LPD2_RAT|nr:ubiquitin-conjugating enzyme E2 J1 isoform X3 [Rattus norvegicus]